MTSQYPPFMDQEHGQPAVRFGAQDGPGAPSSAGPSEVREPDGQRPWSAGRIITVVLGSLLLVVSLVIGIGGGVLAVADKGLRDGQGFFMSRQRSLSSDGYAVASERVELHLEGAGRFVPDRILGDVKVTVTPRGDTPVFVGIATAADAATYLAGVQHSVLADFTSRGGRAGDPVYRQEPGGPPTLAPDKASIWTVRRSGTGTQSVVWPTEAGDWTVVVMNADGSRPVLAEVAVGATFPGLGLVVWILLGVAGCLLVLAIALVVVALRAPTRRSPAPGAPIRQAVGR